MNYELAKELGDTGFVYDKRPRSTIMPYNTTYDCYRKLGLDKEIPLPTLSELIEACGNHVDIQVRETRSSACKITGSMDLTKGVGKTPEEAVARLWLALNKETKSK